MRLPVAGREERRFDVVGLGQCTVDRLCAVDAFPAPDSKQRLRSFRTQPGGQIATALGALGRWGLRTAFVGAIGDDDEGRLVRSALAAEGVDVTGAVVREAVATQCSVILVDASRGERTVLWHREPGLTLAPAEVPLARIREARALLLDGVDGEAAIAAAQQARAAGVLTVADVDTMLPTLARLLPLIDVLLVPWEFARAFTRAADPRAAVERLAGLGASLVGVTLGRDGAVVHAHGRELHVPAFSVTVVDSTGAGDLFRAGLQWGVLAGLDVEAALRLASAAGALQCTRLGAWEGIPALACVRALAGV